MIKRQTIVHEREGGSSYRGSGAKKSRRRPIHGAGYAYAAVFERAEEGGYVVHFPAFGISTQGDTLAEARAMARDLLTGHIEWLLRDGEELPPSDVARGVPRVEVVTIGTKLE